MQKCYDKNWLSAFVFGIKNKIKWKVRNNDLTLYVKEEKRKFSDFFYYLFDDLKFKHVRLWHRNFKPIWWKLVKFYGFRNGWFIVDKPYN